MSALAQCFAVVFSLGMHPPQYPEWQGHVAVLDVNGRWNVPSRIRLEEMRQIYVLPGDETSACIMDHLLHPGPMVKFTTAPSTKCDGRELLDVAARDPIIQACMPHASCLPGQTCS